MKKLHFILIGAIATTLFCTTSVNAIESDQRQNNKVEFIQDQDRIELSADTVILNVGQEFKPELYAKAYRNNVEIPYDGQEFVAIQQEVDTSKVGEYPVVYRLHNTETGGYIDETMIVIVQNNERIDLLSNSVTIYVGQEFNPELYAKAYRNDIEIPYDGQEFVAIQQEVDTSKAGEYPVVYRLHNTETGGYIDETMTVIVKNRDSIEPVSETIVLYVGDLFRPELYAKAYREGVEIPYDGQEFVAIQQEVDTSKPGEYPVVYRLHDFSKGTYVDQTVMVVVKEKNSSNKPEENDKDDIKKPISKPGTTVTTNKTNKQSSNQVLPKTGETNTVHLMRLSGVTLMSGLYVLNKRKIK